MSQEYTPIPILQLLTNPDMFKNLSVFIRLTDRIVKLNFPGDSFVTILQKLKAKGISHVYLPQDEFSQVLTQLNLNAIGPCKFYDPETVSPERQVELNGNAVNIAREFVKKFGISKHVIEVIKTSNANIQTILNTSPGLHAFVKRFKNNCSDQYLRINLTNFLLAQVIGKFSWKNPLIIQKAMMANLLCDIHLDAKDFEILRKVGANHSELPECIFNHTKKAVETLRACRDIIPSEVLLIVEQHHERPDGKGFPYGITASRFNQLAAIFILCHEFVDLLADSDFNYNRHLQILKHLQDSFYGGPFDKAMEALLSVVEL